MALTAHELVVEAKSQIKEVKCQEAAALLEQGALALDVREPEEYAAGHVPGALNIPRGLLEFKIAGEPRLQDRGRPVLVYCKTSGRAALSAVQLQRMGFSNVVSLAGGFDLWAAESLPVVKPQPIDFE
ncbi:MAG: rhodanese-like domain-containing protein [Pseudomonadota bacterium]